MPGPREALVQFPAPKKQKQEHAHKLLCYYIIHNITKDKALADRSVSQVLAFKGWGPELGSPELM